MKKLLLLMIMAMLCGGLWALEFSVGTGGLLGGLFTRYSLKANGTVKVDAGQDMNQFNYGALVFIDATYVEFSFAMQNGRNNWKQIYDFAGSNVPETGDGWESMMSFSLLGKYPFHFGSRLCLFPLVGIEYQIALVQERTQADGWVYDRTDGQRETDKDGKAFSHSDWNSFFINVGGGADFTITGGVFLRGEFLYSFRLMTSYETKNLAYMKAMTGDSSPKLSGLTSGPSLRLSAGYRLWNL